MTILGNQLVNCTKGCNQSVRAKHYQDHLKSKCTAFCEHTILSPSRTTIRDILKRQTDTPTTPVERKVAENLIKRLMAETKEPVIRVPTQGQVQDINIHKICFNE